MKPCSVFSRSLVNVLSYCHNLKNKNEREKQKKCKLGGLPWWSRGKEFTSQCRGHGFNPWLGNYDPTCHGATKSSHYIEDPVQPKKKKRKKACELRRCYFNLNAFKNNNNKAIIC